jgi:uncharacterized membrane protein YsdA (DUF1294 family)
MRLGTRGIQVMSTNVGKAREHFPVFCVRHKVLKSLFRVLIYDITVLVDVGLLTVHTLPLV